MTNINEWCSVSQISGESGTNQVTVNIEEYKGLEDRSHTLKVVSADGMKEVFVTIQQKAFIPILEVSTTSIDMTDETTATINVTSNVDWYCNTDITWINLDIVQGFGDKTITVTAEEFTGQDRNGYINFYIDGKLVKKVEIVQKLLSDEQFYIEPYNLGEEITIVILGDVEYLIKDENKWKSISYKSLGEEITTNKRIYFKNFSFWFISEDKSPFKSISALFKVGGNIETLIGKLEYNPLEYNNYARSLFRDLTNLVDASDLLLPATTLAKNCYKSMFQGCTSLLNTPELPATTLAESCYADMFYGCTNLLNTPELPATTLAPYCYNDMFGACTSLLNTSELPATTLAYWCYQGMFANCTSLVNAPELPATTLAESCYEHMFNGCTSLVNTPKLSATTLAKYCCGFMFANCTSLVNAPELPATTLAEACYQNMFNGCRNLNNITMLATDISAGDCFYNWVTKVSSDGTFTKKQDVYIQRGVSGIPNGWTVIEVP